MVFGDGYPLGHISETGFAAYQGDAVSQLRQGPVQMSSVVNFVGSQFSVQVRPLDPTEMSPTCPIAVQPRAGDNAQSRFVSNSNSNINTLVRECPLLKKLPTSRRQQIWESIV